ncbi:MAG TPA: CHRD domain-containing protein [Actinomycetota bacterium]|nr:CHRD domain-containing protein [Actinomycetota bacterium]
MRRTALKVLTAAIAASMIGAPGSMGTAGASDGGRTFQIALSGANEVQPTNAHGDADRGSVTLTMNLGQRTVCWQFGELTLTAGEALPHISHIHQAPAGVAGGIVLTLFGAPANTGGVNTPTAPTAYPTDTVCLENVSRELLTNIFSDPEQYYVNMHNMTHPAGVVRGQLR